jgi:1-deoxy-D-xylulose-5-phosphate synthase
MTFSDVFGDWCCDMAAQDKRFVAITPAMREGSGLVKFHKQFPAQYYDVAIAEQHAVTLAAGMACDGLKPVVAIYSTFLQRGYDQLVHDVCLQKLPVVFAIDRAGCVGNDGPTHNGTYDVSFMRCLPNIVLMAPSDENECRQMLYTAYTLDMPAAVRYPRGSGTGAVPEKEMVALPVGRAEVRRRGNEVAILAFGTPLAMSLAAAEELDATVVNMRFIKPLDEALILQMAETHNLIVTVEENVIEGGCGSAVNEVLAARGVLVPVLNFGLPDAMLQHGSQDDMRREAGFTREELVRAIKSRQQGRDARAVQLA